MAGFKKPLMARQNSYNSLYTNPLNDNNNNAKHAHIITEEGDQSAFADNKENSVRFINGGGGDKENENSCGSVLKNKNIKCLSTNNANFCLGESNSTTNKQGFHHMKSLSTGRLLKPNSLEFCMQMSDRPDMGFGGSRLWDPIESENSSSLNIWDYSDSEAAPASSWSTLPNRALLCRPLPIDVGRCTCVIVKERLPQGLYGGSLYSLYTNEGQGRQDRKLAVAHHKRRNGKSEFTIAQNTKGILTSSDESFIGTVTANLVGSKYEIWNQGKRLTNQPPSLLAVVRFLPTVPTCTGSHRSMKAYVPKHQSMTFNNAKVQHINGLPENWEGQTDRIYKLCSRTPHYNNLSKQYELDFRDRGRNGLRVQRSVKNFQLTFEENGRQTVLQLGRVDKSRYVIDFRYPLTGYQALCICLTSIDSKLCCSV